MGRWPKRLFTGVTSGGVIGAFVGIPLGVSAAVVDVDAIRPAFYEAIAATIPVLLLAAVLLIRGEGRAVDELEAPRRELRTQIEDLLGKVQKGAAEVAQMDRRGEHLNERYQDAEARSRALLDDLGVGKPMTPILVLLYLAFGLGTLGEVAALAALGSSSSNMVIYLSAGFGVLGLLLLLVMLERNALTRTSHYRQIEDELERELVAHKERQAA